MNTCYLKESIKEFSFKHNPCFALFGGLEKTSVVTFHFVWHFAFNISLFSTPASLRNGGGSWDLRDHNARDVAITPWWSFFGWIKSTAEDFDAYAKFDRLEQLRENLRNLTECLGYRSITLLWQSLTAAKIYFERHWIPKEVPLIVDHPYILVDLDGMGLITTTQAAWLHSRISSTSQKVFFSNMIWIEFQDPRDPPFLYKRQLCEASTR